MINSSYYSSTNPDLDLIYAQKTPYKKGLIKLAALYESCYYALASFEELIGKVWRPLVGASFINKEIKFGFTLQRIQTTFSELGIAQFPIHYR